MNTISAKHNIFVITIAIILITNNTKAGNKIFILL